MGAAYDSRAWTGEVPDYRAMLRRAVRKLLGLDCPYEAWVEAWVIAIHFHSAVSAADRAEIERLCARTSA